MISEKIKSFRESHNMTQSSLAKTLGVERSSTISTEGLLEDDIQLICQFVEHLKKKNLLNKSLHK